VSRCVDRSSSCYWVLFCSSSLSFLSPKGNRRDACPRGVYFESCRGSRCGLDRHNKFNPLRQSKYDTVDQSCINKHCTVTLFLSYPCKTVHDISSLTFSLKGVQHLSARHGRNSYISMAKMVSEDGVIEYKSREVLSSDLITFNLTLQDPHNYAVHLKSKVCCRKPEEEAKEPGKSSLRSFTRQCPSGFRLMSDQNLCFKISTSRVTWNEAHGACRSEHRDAQLLMLTERNQQETIKDYLSMLPREVLAACKQDADDNLYFYTSGQRRRLGNCESAFVWKPNYIPYPIYSSYIQWFSGEPNCYSGKEDCMVMWENGDGNMSDSPCENLICPICQIPLWSSLIDHKITKSVISWISKHY